MKESDRYLKIVEWSDEDQCYIGQCPGLFGGGVHGDDEAAVYRELCEVVMKDISTVRNEPQRLLDWAKIAVEEAQRVA